MYVAKYSKRLRQINIFSRIFYVEFQRIEVTRDILVSAIFYLRTLADEKTHLSHPIFLNLLLSMTLLHSRHCKAPKTFFPTFPWEQDRHRERTSESERLLCWEAEWLCRTHCEISRLIALIQTSDICLFSLPPPNLTKGDTKGRLCLRHEQNHIDLNGVLQVPKVVQFWALVLLLGPSSSIDVTCTLAPSAN